MNNVSLKTKLLVLTLGPLFFLALVGTSFVIWQMEQNGEQRLVDHEEQLLEQTKETLVSHTAIVMGALDRIYASSSNETIRLRIEQEAKQFKQRLEQIYQDNVNQMPARELRNLLMQFAKSYRTESGGYFWINDTSLRMVMHPMSPELEGKYLGDQKDPDGVYLFRQFVQATQKKAGAGFVEYRWPNPSNQQTEQKISYVFSFKPYNWVLGTGEYYADIRRDLQAQAAMIVEGLRYGESGYFWINDFDAKMVMHPTNPSLNGKDLSGFKDPAGKAIFVEFAKVAREQNSGFVAYQWPKPGIETPQPKMSYVAAFPEWKWVLGTGVYIDDIDQTIAKEREQVYAEELRVAWVFVGSSAVLLAIIALLSVFFLRQFVITPFAKMSVFLKGLGLGDLDSHLDLEARDEIGQISDQMNQFAQSLKQRVQLAHAVALGDMQQDVVLLSEQDTLGQSLVKMIESLQEKTKAARLVAAGDLRYHLSLSSDQDILGKALVQMTDDLNQILSQVRADAQRLASSSTELSAVSTQMANSSTEMSAETRTIAAASEQMSANIASLAQGTDHIDGKTKQIADNTSEVTHSISEVTKTVEHLTENIKLVAHQTAQAGKASAKVQALSQKATAAMTRLQKNNQNINQVAKLIQNISAQTRMLALNATIESASAGAAGKGFAVVAGEIKELAMQSGQASEDIGQRVNQIEVETTEAIQAVHQVLDGIDEVTKSVGEVTAASQTQADQAVKMEREMQSSRQRIEQVAGWVGELSGSVGELSGNASELSQGAREVAKAMEQLNVASNETAKGAEQISEESNRLAEIANQLQSNVGRFQIRGEGGAETPAKIT
ncbi:MAG: cache domain-containing protein [bacterium]|nr:cache domain-containing protein [bacterium]